MVTDDVSRLSVNLSPAEMGVLQEYRRRKGVSLTEAVTRAAGVLAFLADVQDRGAVVLVAEPGAEPREVQFVGL